MKELQGLNPCFDGISFRTLIGINSKGLKTNVLILVLMEYPFGLYNYVCIINCMYIVLILVLMEYPFGHIANFEEQIGYLLS